MVANRPAGEAALFQRIRLDTLGQQCGFKYGFGCERIQGFATRCSVAVVGRTHVTVMTHDMRLHPRRVEEAYLRIASERAAESAPCVLQLLVAGHPHNPPTPFSAPP